MRPWRVQRSAATRAAIHGRRAHGRRRVGLAAGLNVPTLPESSNPLASSASGRATRSTGRSGPGSSACSTSVARCDAHHPRCAPAGLVADGPVQRRRSHIVFGLARPRPSTAPCPCRTLWTRCCGRARCLGRRPATSSPADGGLTRRWRRAWLVHFPLGQALGIKAVMKENTIKCVSEVIGTSSIDVVPTEVHGAGRLNAGYATRARWAWHAQARSSSRSRSSRSRRGSWT